MWQNFWITWKLELWHEGQKVLQEGAKVWEVVLVSSLLDPLGSIRAQYNHVATSMDQDGARPTTDQDTKIYQNF